MQSEAKLNYFIKMETSYPCRACLLRYNAYEFLLVPNCATIQVLDSPSNILLDTLHGHTSVVTGIDASQTGIIVSISMGNDICFHMNQDPQVLKWTLTFKTQMQGGLSVSKVKISSIGDMCVMGGDKFVSVWAQDTTLDSFTQQIFYCSDQDIVENQMCQVPEVLDTLQQRIKQVEISGDGRLFVTLEENCRHLKVWHQNNLRAAPASDLKIRRYFFEELQVYETEESGLEVESFRMMYKSPNAYQAEPCTLMTIQKMQVKILIESLMDTNMRFVCLKTIKLSPRLSHFEALFIQSKPYEPPQLTTNQIESHHLSKIFDSYRDEELKCKQRNNQAQYGLIPTYAESKTGLLPGFSALEQVKFVVMEDSQVISVYKITGFTNEPLRNHEVKLVKKVQIEASVSFREVIACVLLVQPQHQQNDQMRLVTQNDRGHIYNFDFDIRKCSLSLRNTYAMHANQSQITLTRAHHELPLLAIVHQDEIVVFNRSQLYAKVPKVDHVRDLCWVGDLNQFLVLREGDSQNSVELLSSEWLLLRKRPLVVANTEELDTFRMMHSLQVSKDVIAVQVICLEKEGWKVQLHFTCIHEHGATTNYALHYSIDAETETEVQEGRHQELGFVANQTCKVVTTQLLENAGFCLLFTEHQLGGRAQRVEQALLLLKVTKSKSEVIFNNNVSVNHPVFAKITRDFLVVSVVEGEFHKYKYVLYLYNLRDNQYLGYLQLSELLRLQPQQGLKIAAMDFQLSPDGKQLKVLAEDQAYLLTEKHSQWRVAHQAQFSSVMHASMELIDEVAVVGNQFVVEVPQMKADPVASLPLYHPAILKAFFFKGYAKQVAQILVEVTMHLADSNNPLPELANIMFEDDKPAPVVKKQFNAFADFDDESEEEEDIFKIKVEEPADFSQQFLEKFENLIEGLQVENCPLKLQKTEILCLIEFLYKFQPLFQTDFYCDKLATHLLFEVFVDTEKPSAADINNAKISLGLVQGIKITKTESRGGGLNMEEFINQKIGLAFKKSEVDKSKVSSWSSMQVCMALYSENQDVILDQLSQRLDFETGLTWGLMRKLGIPLWLKSDTKLKQLVELIAKNEYRLFDPDGHQTKPEYAALWYVLTGKIQVIKQLFNVEKDGKRFADFLASDFNQAKPRTIAGKNAMALVSKRKNTLACSFYLLAQDLKNAIQISLERCNDPMLALLMCRMTDPQNEQKQMEFIVNEHFIQKGTQFNDPYLKSIGQWHSAQYVKAVNELKPTKISAADSLFKRVKEFDLAAFSLEQTISGEVAAPAQQQNFPQICLTSYSSLELLARLRKVPEVKRVLHKDWELDKKSKAGGGMFDDLMDSESEEEEEQVVEDKEEIRVDETGLLESIVTTLLASGHTLLSQLLIKENAVASSKLSQSLKGNFASIQMTDMMLKENVNTQLIQSTICSLSQQLSIEIDMQFVSTQLSKLQNRFQVEIHFLHQSGAQQKLIHARILTQADSLVRFIDLSSLYCGKLLQSDDRSAEGSKRLKVIADQIKCMIETLIIISAPQTQIIAFPKQTKAEVIKPVVSAPKKQSGWFDEDEDEENDSCQLIEDEVQPNEPIISQTTKCSKLKTSDLLSELTFRCQMGVLLTTSLFQLCLMANKMSLLSDIHTALMQFLSVWNWSAQAVVSESQIQQYIDKLKFREVMDLAVSVKKSIELNIEHAESEHTVRRKQRNYQHIDHQHVYDAVVVWFKFNTCITLFDDIFQNGIRILGAKKLQPTHQVFSQKELLTNSMEDIGFMPSDLVKVLDDEFKLYEKQSLHLFQYTCSSEQRASVLFDLQNVLSADQLVSNPKIIDFRYFMKSDQKISTFFKTFNLKKHLSQIIDIHLSQTKLGCGPVEEILNNGIELFKQKGEPIADFCVKGDTLAIALLGKGMREINITCSLLFRNRTAQFDLVDEELFSWFDCLHRFDQHLLLPWTEPQHDPVRQALLTHQMKEKLSSIVLQKPFVIKKEQLMWDGRPESDYLQQVSQLDITHEDFSSAICAHPQLPVYFTGNAKGIICMWHFDQHQNRSLNQWVLEPDLPLKEANPKKSAVKKINFSNYGDKFVSLNAEGTLFLHSFDLRGDGGTLYVHKGHKITDFGLMDPDCTVIAALSSSTKTLSIIDCMTGDILVQSKTVGNMLQVDAERQCLYTFNSKSGAIQQHDCNLQVILTKQLHKEEVTSSVWCGHRMASLMVGFSDGTIRVYEVENSDKETTWEPKQTFGAFATGGKKGAVTSLQVHKESGVVFGASSQGSVKMLRVHV